VERVLDGLEEDLRLWLGRGVIRRQGEDLAHPQVDPTLARADVPDALQLLVEEVDLAWTRRVLEPLVIQGESLDQEFGGSSRGPLAELGAARTADPGSRRRG